MRNRKEQKKIQLNSLRTALIHEIGAIENYSEWETVFSLFDFDIPKVIYQSNAERIGRLSEQEIELVVDYYTKLEILLSLIEFQRKANLGQEPNWIRTIEKFVEGAIESVKYLLSRGKYGFKPPQARSEHIREEFENLSQLQDEAIGVLESNLD